MYLNIKSKQGYNINLKEMVPDNPKEIILAIHGFAGDKESSAIEGVANELNKDNIGVIALDLPGHGVSEVDGDYLTLDNCLNDIDSVIEYIKKQYPNVLIDMFATSFGAYLALTKLNRDGNSFNKVILRCPAIKMDKILVNEIINESLKTFKQRGYTIVGYERELKVNYSYYEELLNNKLDKVNFRCDNLLIIHGTSDTTAPTQDSIDFATKNNIKIQLVEGADHRFKKPGELDKVISMTKDFLIKNYK